MHRFGNISFAISVVLLTYICSAQQPANKAVSNLTRYTGTRPATHHARGSYGLPANGSPVPYMPSSADKWNGGTGNWSNNGNWSAGVPGATNDVTIYSGGSDLVTLDVGTTTINSLALGGVNGSSELTDGGTKQSLTITNAVAVGQTGYLSLYGGSTISAGSLTNSGSVDVENGSTLTINGDASNSGTFDVSSGLTGGNTLIITGTLTNSNDFELFNAKVTMAGLANSGEADVEGRGTLQINGNAINSRILGTDIYNLAPGGGNTLIITGTLTNQSGGALIIFGDGFSGGGDMATLGGLVNSGGVDVENRSTLRISGDVTNSGVIATSICCPIGYFGSDRNTVSVSGMLTNTATGLIELMRPGDTLQVNGNLDNFGTLNQSSGTTITVNGLLTNEASGQISVVFSDSVLQALGGLTNGGLINATRGSSIDPPFLNNLGIINIDSASRLIVGTGSPMGLGYIQLHNGTLGEMISSTGYGVINANGSALLAGTLAILLQGGYTPGVGSTYKFLFANSGQISGVFSNIENDFFNGGTEQWLVTYDNADGYVELRAEVARPVLEPATLLVLIPSLLGAGYGLRRRRLGITRGQRLLINSD